MPVIASGIGGQPGMLMIGLSLMMSATETAPVGLGLALGMPPKAAQVPIEITAKASLQVSSRMARFD